MTTPEERLAVLGLVLPDLPKPIANYVPFRLLGSTLYLSGQVPRLSDGTLCTGRVGETVTVDEAYEHIKLCALQLIATARVAAGNLSKVSVVKVFGMINATPEFKHHPAVINGASDLFVSVFGEAGYHARSSVGMGSLPNNVTVEVEAVMHVG